MDKKSILKQLNAIRDIPTLPVITMEINRMLESYDTSIETLSSAIERDQSIASKVLRLVNSSFFGLRAKVTRIRDAVVLLGFDSVRNIVLSVSLVNAFSGALSKSGFNITLFWHHSVNVAMTSKRLSQLSGKEEPECCFTAGLLHDIGKIILSQYFPALFESIIMKAMREEVSFAQAEKIITQLGHEKVGGYLAAKWKLPVHLVDVVRYHHSVSPRASNLNLVKIVHAANQIAGTLSLETDFIDDRAFDHVCHGMNKAVLKDFRPQLKQVGYWYSEMAADIKDACQFFTE